MGHAFARQGIDVDPVAAGAALERREADRERALGHAVAGQEGARLEAGGRQDLGEALERLGVDHLGADAGDAPGRQVERFGVAGAQAPGAQGVAERRAEGDGAAVARDQRQPQARAHREVARRQVVDRALGGDAAEDDADQPHVVVVRQPGAEAIVGAELEAVVEDRLQVGHHRRLGDHGAAREAGAARGVLQVGELLGRGRRRQLVGGVERHELVHGAGERQRQAVGGLAQEADEIRRGEGRDRFAVAHQLAQVADVDLAAAEVDGGGQRHGHQAGVLAGVEHHREVGVGVGHQGQALAAAERRQAPGQLQGAGAQIAVRAGGRSGRRGRRRN